jgi:hypothetical protein
MNSRERFRQTMSYGQPDQVPLFMEGIRKDVISTWRLEGMPPGKLLLELFTNDQRVEITPELEPRPNLVKDPAEGPDIKALERSLDPDDPGRLPAGWPDRIRELSGREDTMMLRVHRGLYQTLGVTDWHGFTDVNYLFVDDPILVHKILEIQANFAARLTQRVLSEVEIDAAVFSEPISDNNGPLISPKMFEEFGFPSYEPLLEVLQRNGVQTIIFRSYANARILVPLVLKWGFNCLWACEENLGAMDYGVIRREFGRDLRLIGGIDVDVLRQDKEMIRREVMGKVPPLLSEGGYVPLADGRIRANVSYENYVYYRSLLEKVVQGEVVG